MAETAVEDILAGLSRCHTISETADVTRGTTSVELLSTQIAGVGAIRGALAERPARRGLPLTAGPAIASAIFAGTVGLAGVRPLALIVVAFLGDLAAFGSSAAFGPAELTVRTGAFPGGSADRRASTVICVSALASPVFASTGAVEGLAIAGAIRIAPHQGIAVAASTLRFALLNHAD